MEKPEVMRSATGDLPRTARVARRRIRAAMAFSQLSSELFKLAEFERRIDYQAIREVIERQSGGWSSRPKTEDLGGSR